jgi:hypothetical protein
MIMVCQRSSLSMPSVVLHLKSIKNPKIRRVGGLPDEIHPKSLKNNSIKLKKTLTRKGEGKGSMYLEKKYEDKSLKRSKLLYGRLWKVLT